MSSDVVDDAFVVLLSKFAKSPKLLMIRSPFAKEEGEVGSDGDSMRGGVSSSCWGEPGAVMQAKGSVGGDCGGLMFSVGRGEERMGELGSGGVGADSSDTEPRPRCCGLLERTKFLRAGRMVLES